MIFEAQQSDVRGPVTFNGYNSALVRLHALVIPYRYQSLYMLHPRLLAMIGLLVFKRERHQGVQSEVMYALAFALARPRLRAGEMKLRTFLRSACVFIVSLWVWIPMMT